MEDYRKIAIELGQTLISKAPETREDVERMLPELKESEDERIRKRIIALINAHGQSMYKDEILAWLEKQGQTFTKKDVDDAYLKGISDTKNELEKQGEQKSINDLTPQKAMDIAVAKCFDEQKPYGQREERVDCQFNYAGECKGYCAMKRGEQNLVNFEEAEKEKSDFVSGKFIQCRKSFNEFKEDNSYWLEYIGDDTYIGRSDNILNQKFHITPRQLYRLFSQEHCI